nr:MAG TPA: hypothetical protein [Caudoviricetes sp.]
MVNHTPPFQQKGKAGREERRGVGKRERNGVRG